MSTSIDFLCISRLCRVGNNVCVHVCKTKTDNLYVIIYNCIVVINCGWNNNVAVKMVSS